MADVFTKKKRSDVMSRIRSKGTTIEKVVEKHLRKAGLRFRTHYKVCGCRVDIAFPKKKIAIFVDGDFWHGWQYPRWRKKLPSDFWRKKIEGNRARDRRVFSRLRRNGWEVVRIWEHELRMGKGETVLSRLSSRLKK